MLYDDGLAFKKTGDEQGVYFGRDQEDALRERDLRTIHNHPHSQKVDVPPSQFDIHEAMLRRETEQRVVVPGGEYRVSPPAGVVWDGQTSRRFVAAAKEMAKVYTEKYPDCNQDAEAALERSYHDADFARRLAATWLEEIESLAETTGLFEIVFVPRAS